MEVVGEVLVGGSKIGSMMVMAERENRWLLKGLLGRASGRGRARGRRATEREGLLVVANEELGGLEGRVEVVVIRELSRWNWVRW